ncbi:glycosyltransferase family 9 protein [Niveibacterium sp. SC-1]|uniref:glycosyltransferase family 9 protein n=1 Tax=Niveibacterium sp. SC-1 TaxID=3135646 RepID=UPI00311DD25C
MLAGTHCVAIGIYSGLGDIVCALPSVMRLRASGRRVILVMSVGIHRVAAELLAQHLPPGDVLTVQWPPGKNLKSVWGLVQALRRERVQAFLVSPHPQLVHASRKLPWLMAALRGLGMRVLGAQADHRSWVYSHKVAVDRDLPIATREWQFLADLSGHRERGSFDWEPFRPQRVAQRSGGVLIHVGASKPNRRLPTRTVLDLIRQLETERPVRVVGLPAELQELKALYAESTPAPGADVAFVSGSLVQALDTLKHMDCSITMDSAFAHLAAAYGVPQVIVFGPSDPVSNRPVTFVPQTPVIQETQKLPCQPCGLHTCELGDFRCMNLISAAQIHAAVNRMLAARPEAAAAV